MSSTNQQIIDENQLQPDICTLNKDQKEALLRPYKSVGVFTDQNRFHVYSIANQNYLLTSTDNAFKIFKLPHLKIQLLSPTFPHKIRAFTALNEFVFIGVKNIIYKMRYYHLISQIELPSKVQKLIVLGKYLIALSQGGLITVIEHNQNQIIHTINTAQSSQNSGESSDIEHIITDIIHPPTYLNKLLVYGPYHLQIWNISTQKLIYTFDKFLEEFRDQKNEISCVECSPVLDIVSIAFNDGRIYFFDLREDTILFKVKLQLPAISMAFSKQDPPLLACGDEKGNIIIWDLNERKKFTTLKEMHKGSVNSLHFMGTEQSLLSASGQANEVFQWKYEEISDAKFIINRRRNGLKANISKLRYMDKDHILASTNYDSTELREISLLNECMSQFYSVKQQSQKQMKNKHILTETTVEQDKPVKDFSFSMNRARDWSNVITIHQDSTKPCLFNSEDKSIVKKNVELYDTDKTKKQEAESQITSVYTSNCGNFGVLGFQSGKIIKFNMQSGKLQKVYRNEEQGHSSTITSIFVNYCNKYLVSACQNNKLVIWDFYSAGVIFSHQFQNNSILFMRPAKFVDQFIVGLTDCTLEIWDTQLQKMGRKFEGHTNRITDACWVESNKQIISAGMDGLLNIYDILSNQLVQSIKMSSNKYYITSLDMCNDILVTSFNNSRQVFMWHNLIDSLYWNTGNQTKTIEFKSLLQYHTNSRQHFYLSDKIKNEELEKEQDMELELNIVGEDDDSLIRFTKLESGKWLPLAYIDEIKERNKLENTEKEDIKMPFFLDFDNKDKVKQELHQELKEKIDEQSKLLTEEKEKYLVELEQGLDNCFLNVDTTMILDNKFENNKLEELAQKFLDFLCSLNYTQVDYEMRKFLFGNIDNIKLITIMFNTLFNSRDQIDIKNVYFNNFLKISSYDIMQNVELLELFQEIKQKIKTQQSNLENKVNYITCLSENFAKIPN